MVTRRDPFRSEPLLRQLGVVVLVVSLAGYAASKMGGSQAKEKTYLFTSPTTTTSGGLHTNNKVKRKELTFWRSSSAEAAFFASEERFDVKACPKVFVYALKAELTDWQPKWRRRQHSDDDESTGTDSVSVPSEAVDENANLLEVILTRLVSSKRCLAKTPKDADLFLVPLLPKAKHWRDWSRLCQSVASLRQIQGDLPYLTEANARRHVFVFPRVGYQPKCRGWWTTPMPSVLANFARVAVGGYEEFQGDFQRGKTAKLSNYQKTHPHLLVPRLVSAPYVANVRWDTKKRRRREEDDENDDATPRRYLFAYSGTPHGAALAVKLRVALKAACDANPAQCASSALSFRRDERKEEWPREARLRATLEMRNATFCPQPPGLTPGRSSIVTALLLGCIPVFFAKEQDQLWPLHLKGWLQDARLFVPAETALDGNAFLKALIAVTPDRIRHMRHAIRRHAQRLQYALDDMPDDALEVLLRGLHAAAGDDRGDGGAAV